MLGLFFFNDAACSLLRKGNENVNWKGNCPLTFGAEKNFLEFHIGNGLLNMVLNNLCCFSARQSNSFSNLCVETRVVEQRIEFICLP